MAQEPTELSAVAALRIDIRSIGMLVIGEVVRRFDGD